MDKINEYLLQNASRIKRQRKDGTLRWTEESDRLFKEFGVKADKELLRNRFNRMFKNLDIPNTIDNTAGENVVFKYISGKEDKVNGTKSFDFTADHIPTEEEIVEHFNIDLKKFRINQIYHKTSFGGKYAITVSLLANKGVQSLDIDESFLDKVSALAPLPKISTGPLLCDKKTKACLVIPKQDAHWNAFDIYGDNSIEERFVRFTKALHYQLEKATASNQLEKIIYIVGSDEFNSEYNNATTKGTPQQNILSYQEAFEKITEFNIQTIKLLKSYGSFVEVVLLNGNHDYYVGWHLANVLKHLFKNTTAIKINDSTENIKVLDYAKNLLLFNHGDASSPKELAGKFPVISHEVWSNYSNYVVICGDKHHERSADINGIICYQVPQLSKAVSSWSEKRGYVVSKAELLTFLFEEEELVNIFRKQIK